MRRNRRRATEYYKQAARAGNEQARSLVMPPHAANRKDDYMLLSVMSQRVVTMVSRVSSPLPQLKRPYCALSAQLHVSLPPATSSSRSLPTSAPQPLPFPSCLTPGALGAFASPLPCLPHFFPSVPLMPREEPASGPLGWDESGERSGMFLSKSLILFVKLVWMRLYYIEMCLKCFRHKMEAFTLWCLWMFESFM